MTQIKAFCLTDSTHISTMFLDESGSKHSEGGFFVVGMVKARDVGRFLRGLRDIRDTHHVYEEMKFSKITRGSTRFYFDIAEYLAASNVRIGASVYDSNFGFEPGKETWLVQAKMSARLVAANVNRDGEAVNVLLDLVQTPRDHAMSEVVRGMVRKRLKSASMIEAYDLDSRSTDGLQVADFVASAISHERRFGKDGNSPKAQVAARLRRAFGLDSFDDVREGKVNILTMENDISFKEVRKSRK